MLSTCNAVGARVIIKSLSFTDPDTAYKGMNKNK